jgi:hypothetical protein
MGTKFIDNRIETTDYDVAGYLLLTKQVSYEIFDSNSEQGRERQKVKIITKMGEEEFSHFWKAWTTSALKVDPNKYGQSIRQIRQAVQTLLDKDKK